MLTNLLWLWDAKLQYERQKSQGLAGLISILLVILIIWRWDSWFYPFFYRVGLVGLAERTGLVSDLSVITAMNVIAVFFLICFFIALICLLFVLSGMVLLVFGASNLGKLVIGTALIPILLPYYIFLVFKRNQITSIGAISSSEMKELKKKYKDLHHNNRLLHFYIEQLKNTDETFQVKKWNGVCDHREVQSYLNRVLFSIKDNNVFLLAYHHVCNKQYLVFPNPLPKVASNCFQYETSSNHGLFGFAQKCYELVANSGKYGFDEDDYYVPAIEFSIFRKEDILSIEVDDNNDVETMNIANNIDFYLIHSTEIQKLVHNVLKDHKKLLNRLQRAHLAFYMIPIIYRKGEYFKYGYNKFVEESQMVLHSDVGKMLYHADVRNEIKKYATSGEEWAIDWLKKVE